jgi:enoyl-CoA hydratase/carnithine racemase
MALLLQETRGVAHWLTIDRPEAQNAVNWALFPLIEAGIRAAVADPQVRVIVLTGQGTQHFCVGGDLQADAERAARGLAPDWLKHPLQHLFEVVERCPLPIVARINGHCIGPGMSLLAMCDLAVAVDTARFGLGEVKVGLMPGLALAYLQRLVPKRRLLELALCGEPVGAREALEMGLLNHLAPADAFDAKVDALIARLADKSPDAQRRIKALAKTIEDIPLDQGWRHGAAAVSLALLTEDFREGMRALAERRPAQWPARPTAF